jgi:hypothetical protein
MSENSSGRSKRPGPCCSRRSSGYDCQAGDARPFAKFRKLGSYILNPAKVPQSPSPPSGSEWRRTTDYILDIAGGGSRTEGVRITNCASVETEWAIREIELTQSMNQRAKGSRTYHLVVSFPAGERPTQEQLIDIENELCAAIGLGGHQRISAVHTDTDHLHIHVAINQIHPQTHNCVEPWYDKAKLMKACERLEVKHGLQRTYHGKSVEAGRLSDGAVAMEQHRGVQSLQSWIRQEALPHIGPALEKAQCWQDAHALLARYDLEIQPRGAGLVIKTRRGSARVKASSIDRAWSAKALIGRLGAFVPPDPAIKLPRKQRSYRRRAVHTGDDVNRLWTEYQQARQDAIGKRQTALATIDQHIRQRRQAIYDWYSGRLDDVHNYRGLTKLGKESEFNTLKLQFATKRANLDQAANNQRAHAKLLNRPPSWIGFLRERSAGGDAAARSALQKQEQRFLAAMQAHLKAQISTDAEVQEQILRELKPEPRPEGKIAYRFRDGGVLRYGSEGDFYFERMSPFALVFGLHLNVNSGPFRPLNPFGGAQELIVMAVAGYALQSTFADPALEKDRQRLRSLAEGDANFAAALTYIVEYQASVAERDGYFPCLVWEPGHAGPATLERLVTLRNGARAAVLRRETTLMVKVCDDGDLAALQALQGKPVTVAVDGQVSSATDSRTEIQPLTKRRWFRLA